METIRLGIYIFPICKLYPSETTRSAFLTTLAYKRVSGITSKNSNLNLEWLVVVTDGNDTLH